MKKLNLVQFKNCITAIHNFMQDQEKLNEAIKIISPSSTGVVEFGNEFVDKYIWLLENQMDDNNYFISWYIFENEFGAKKFQAGVNGNYKPIITDEDLYNLILSIG